MRDGDGVVGEGKLNSRVERLRVLHQGVTSPRANESRFFPPPLLLELTKKKRGVQDNGVPVHGEGEGPRAV